MDLQKTILLVEDEAPLREAIKFKLEKGGYNVIEARTGEEALLLLKDHTPDLVWLDLLLPGINGVDVLRQIRENPLTSTMKVVVVSVSIAGDKITDISNLNVSGCITKSNFPLDEIVQKVVVHLVTPK
jgi:CheY-like chemotaxis protein